jgi:hypothetical protein
VVSAPRGVQIPVAGSNDSELDKLFVPSLVPPATRTVPSGSNVAV